MDHAKFCCLYLEMIEPSDICTNDSAYQDRVHASDAGDDIHDCDYISRLCLGVKVYGLMRTVRFDH